MKLLGDFNGRQNYVLKQTNRQTNKTQTPSPQKKKKKIKKGVKER